MSVHHILLCLFFLSLQAANSSSAHGLELFYGHIGGDVTMKCSFSTSRWSELSFCRENCDEGNMLIQTNYNTAERGRYRIHYNEQVLSVSISGLTRSDSGRYRCAVGRASHTEVELVVAEALLEKSQQEPFSIEAGSSLTVGCSFNFKVSVSKKLFCRGDCWDGGEILVQTDGVRAERGRYRIGFVDGRIGGGVLYVSITQLTQSDSGRYRCYMDRIGPDGSIEFSIQVSAAPTAYKPTDIPPASTPTATQSWSSSSGSSKHPASSHSAEPPQGEGAACTDVLLIVGLSVAIGALLLSVALLVFCRRRSCRPLRGLMSRKSEEVKLESCSPPTCEDPTYQSLSPGSRDQDQIYSTLTEHT
ncbi:polymeric immunoglobulin receptor-like isoform 3-T3 [Menidia menidia]